MNTINKRQAYRYNFQFNYSRAGITYNEFIKILPYFGVKNALIAKDQQEEYLIGQVTLAKKLVLKSVINHFWSIIPRDRKDSLFHVSYTCDEDKKVNIFENSKNIYYYPKIIKKSTSFVRAPVLTDKRYAWKSDLDDILTSQETINDSRHLIHIWGNASENDGKTNFIKHKCMNSTIFDFISPLCTRAEIASYLTSNNKKSYFFVDIPRVVKGTRDFFLIAQELKDGMLALSLSVKNRSPYFDIPVVVIFSNDLPPLDCLSKDRWKIYRIEYDNEGSSKLKYMSQEDCVETLKMVWQLAIPLLLS